MMNYRALIILSILWVGASTRLEGAGFDVHGYLDIRGGSRIQSAIDEKSESLAELRLQLEREFMGDFSTVTLRSDFVYDGIPDNNDLDLEDGTGWIDLREASVLVPVGAVDIKVGRQILTWGTGDLLFINDMFPKDWQSFFVGRDEEYLKAPSDALFVSIFPEFANIDIAYTPRFDSDRYIRGERISYWNPMLSAPAGRNAIVSPLLPDEWFEDHEIALRISKNLSGYEAALYGYYGFWKNPEGMDEQTMTPYFPELSVYGASVRGSLGRGLINVECGYYDSREDNQGTDPYVPNDEGRVLVGYEQELVRNLSGSLQYYVEHMFDYDEYLSATPYLATAADENRHLVTLRITKQALSQNLVISLFVYYSPSDEDLYTRPVVSYKASDAWLLTAGANIFDGRESYTFFGQFEDNSNVYAGARCSF